MNKVSARSAHSNRRPTRYAFALSLLVYQFAFFNVVLPGHTRGSITVDGRQSRCPMCSVDGGLDHSRTEPTSRDRAHCAICDFAAHVTLPQIICLAMPEFGMLHLLPIPPPRGVELQRLPSPDDCRGPPSCSV